MIPTGLFIALWTRVSLKERKKKEGLFKMNVLGQKQTDTDSKHTHTHKKYQCKNLPFVFKLLSYIGYKNAQKIKQNNNLI